MNFMVITKNYNPPAFNTKEILRYAGCKEANFAINTLLEECINEVKDKLVFKVCFASLPVFIKENEIDFSAFKVECKGAVVFAATIGVEIDRFIQKYGYISPAKAVMIDAIGAERIEALCDTFVKDIQAEFNSKFKPRFSAGYGDLSIATQKDIFNLLNPSKHIGITINDSMLISPSKSVTAFVGYY